MAGSDTLPSGSWGIGPLIVHWDLKALNEVDVTVSVLGVNVDTLSGTVNSTDAVIESDVNILGVVTGHLKISAIYVDPDAGLWIEGELKAPGIDTGALKHRIVSW